MSAALVSTPGENDWHRLGSRTTARTATPALQSSLTRVVPRNPAAPVTKTLGIQTRANGYQEAQRSPGHSRTFALTPPSYTMTLRSRPQLRRGTARKPMANSNDNPFKPRRGFTLVNSFILAVYKGPPIPTLHSRWKTPSIHDPA